MKTNSHPGVAKLTAQLAPKQEQLEQLTAAIRGRQAQATSVINEQQRALLTDMTCQSADLLTQVQLLNTTLREVNHHPWFFLPYIWLPSRTARVGELRL